MEALGWLSRAVEAYEPAVAAAVPGEVYPLPLAWALELRSTVLAVLERRAEALADAKRSIDITLDHYAKDYASVDDRAPLALRLIEHDRHREAVDLLRADHPLARESPSTWSTPRTPLLLAIARSRVLLDEGEANRAAQIYLDLEAAAPPRGCCTSTRRCSRSTGRFWPPRLSRMPHALPAPLHGALRSTSSATPAARRASRRSGRRA